MKGFRARVQRDERGTALILAIAFMLIIGGISGALLSSVASGLNSRQALDNARNREYAADGLIEYAIAQARGPVAGWNTSADLLTFLASASSCGGPYQSGVGGAPALNGFNNTNKKLHVDCTPAPGQTQTGALTRNAIFTACAGSTTCTDASTIVRAQVNFDSASTIVQAWSVNG
jgi:hypothetical protein